MVKRISKAISGESIHSDVIGEKYRNEGKGFCNWVEKNVCIPIYPEGEDIAVWTPMNELPTTNDAVTGRSYRYMWEKQKDVCMKALQMENGRFIYRLIVLCWPRGDGKCSKKGSLVLLYNGDLKKVENIVVGDILMGDDNTPRKVLSLHNGKEEMCQVVPVCGEPMIVTYDHILSLKRRRRKRKKPTGGYYPDYHAEEVVDISVEDYQKQSQAFKNTHLQFSVPIDWPAQSVPIDPYFLGMWLADGSATAPAITTMDEETIAYIHEYAEELQLSVSVYDKQGTPASLYRIVGSKGGKENPLLTLLRENNLIRNKHIPQKYKINSREVRMQILAGILDGDGYKNRNSFEIVQKRKVLSDDIAFIARSLGFHVCIKKVKKGIKSLDFEGEYYRIGITGDCVSIPVLIPRRKCSPRRGDWKDPLVTGIKEIKSAGVHEYYGFTLDGNGRYVTGDFTVTHNSLLAILIQLWKFFNWPRQTIVLGANSKDQTKFVHYDMMKDIILHSPNLKRAIGGERNVQEKEIRLKDADGAIQSVIKPISTSSGIVSNITGYTFSEMFDMRNPKFFTQLDGSTRNIPNAIGVIDSTVSAKDHVLYNLYENFIKKKTKTLFFSYRCSERGVQEDYWNPFMNNTQLEDYRAKFLEAEFARYFLNTWSAGATKVFSDDMISEIGQLGSDGQVLNHLDLQAINQKVGKLKKRLTIVTAKNFVDGIDETLNFVDTALSRIQQVSDVYKLEDNYQNVQLVSPHILNSLGDLLNTDWAILAGIDLADPLAIRKKANSVMVLIAKGLPNSKIDPHLMVLDEKEISAAKFIYFIIGFYVLESNTPINDIRTKLDMALLMYDGIDIVCGERYGLWDLATWAEENDVPFNPIYPNYERQRAAFNHLYSTMYLGLLKAPPISYMGIKGKEDLFREELGLFDHSAKGRWFGSPEKGEKYGIQDDSVYAVGWGMYGGRHLGPDQFRSMEYNTGNMFGSLFINKDVLGKY